jgi:hypothetical protein
MALEVCTRPVGTGIAVRVSVGPAGIILRKHHYLHGKTKNLDMLRRVI